MNTFDEIAARQVEFEAQVAAAEEGCKARGWRFGGVHNSVSGAWSATPCRPSRSTVKGVRALSFAEFTFAFLEAVEKRELEIAQRAQARQASSAARSSLPEVAQ